MSDHDITTPGPSSRKSWFARHKILTGILAVLIVFAVGGALSGGEDTPSAATQTSAEPAHASAEEGTGSSAGSQGSTADESAAKEDTAAEKEAQAAEDKAAEEKKAKEKEAEEKKAEEEAQAAADAAPGVGERVEVGQFSVRVTQVEPGLDWIGDSTFGEAPQGQFVKVHLTVENTGDEAEYFFDSDQKLVDGKDRQHSTSSSAWLLEEESLFLAEINPGNKIEGVLLYDIPADAAPVAVDLQAGWLSKPVRVSLEG